MGKKVLIIDDSSTMRKIVTRSLRQAGLDFDTILEAGDGQEALQLLAKENVDIILSDINMPNMDGIEFLRQKSANAAIKGIPVPGREREHQETLHPGAGQRSSGRPDVVGKQRLSCSWPVRDASRP